MVCREQRGCEVMESLVFGFQTAGYTGSPVWGFLGSLVWGMQKQPFRIASRDFVAFFPLMWQEKQHKLPLFPFLVAFWQPYLL